MTFSTAGYKRIYFEDLFAHNNEISKAVLYLCICTVIQNLDNDTLEELFCCLSYCNIDNSLVYFLKIPDLLKLVQHFSSTDISAPEHCTYMLSKNIYDKIDY